MNLNSLDSLVSNASYITVIQSILGQFLGKDEARQLFCNAPAKWQELVRQITESAARAKLGCYKCDIQIRNGAIGVALLLSKTRTRFTLQTCREQYLIAFSK